MYSSAVEATIIQQTWLIYLQTCLQGSFYAFIEIAWLTVSSLPWEIMDAESLRKYKKQLDKFIEEKFIQCIKLQLTGCQENIWGQYHCRFMLFSQVSQAPSFGTAEN